MATEHLFEGSLAWAGQPESQPFDAQHWNRSTRLSFEGGATIEASSPPVFGGDGALPNPETLMIASLMQCHFLTFMAFAVRKGMRVTAYDDRATGRLGMKDGRMRFVEVVLRPRVAMADAPPAAVLADMHQKAHQHCFMSNSVNFDVRVEPATTP
ncbi:MAG: OsmC family protein [Burkholderiaceae bacterium]|nr:OsmC family protein [Burkholderiaceae bacterium]